MPAVKSSLIHPAYKTEYRVRNWPEYERSLVRRGDATLWTNVNDADCLAVSRHLEHPLPGKASPL